VGAGQQPPTVDAVVGLLDVQYQHDARGAYGRQVFHEALGEQHVVGNGAATQEGCLSRGNPKVEGRLQAVGEDALGQLEVGVEEGDRAVGS
jgi:hypothetical protein